MDECVIEPMAVIHTGCVIAVGCFISAGAVINYTSMCADSVHVDCNAMVASITIVPAAMKIKCGKVNDRKDIDVSGLFFNPEEWAKRLNKMKQPHTPHLSMKKRTILTM